MSDMTKNLYADSSGEPHRITEHGKTWVSDELLVAMGWTRVADDYEAPVNADVLLANAKTAKEATIKALLAETDYKAIKWAEGQLTDTEYEPIKLYRESLRNTYNAIETATMVEQVETISIPE